MNPVSAYIDALSKYFDYHGTVSRREYWMFMIATIIIRIIVIGLLMLGLSLVVLTGIGGVSLDILTRDYPENSYYGITAMILVICYLFICFFTVFLPGLALMARRLNDMGWSRWCLLLVVLFMIPLPPFGYFPMIPIIVLGCISSRND